MDNEPPRHAPGTVARTGRASGQAAGRTRPTPALAGEPAAGGAADGLALHRGLPCLSRRRQRRSQSLSRLSQCLKWLSQCLPRLPKKPPKNLPESPPQNLLRRFPSASGLFRILFCRLRNLLTLPWRGLRYLFHDTPLGRLLGLTLVTGTLLVALALLLQAWPVAGFWPWAVMGLALSGWLLRHPLVLLAWWVSGGR